MAVNPLVTLGGVGVVALGVVGGLYATGTGKGDENTTIVWKPLSKDDDYNTKVTATSGESYKGKYGETYGHYLTGTHDDNNAWWEQAFTYYKNNKTKAKGKFKDLDKKEDKTFKSLKDVCIAAYKDEKENSGKIKTSVQDSSTDDILEDNIWEFCSPAKAKIKSITDENNSTNEYASTSSQVYGDDTKAKKVLVSIASTSGGNTWFWNLKKQENSVYTETDKVTTQDGDVKAWCKEAYRKTTEDTQNYPKAKVFKWCSLTGKEPSNP